MVTRLEGRKEELEHCETALKDYLLRKSLRSNDPTREKDGRIVEPNYGGDNDGHANSTFNSVATFDVNNAMDNECIGREKQFS